MNRHRNFGNGFVLYRVLGIAAICVLSLTACKTTPRNDVGGVDRNEQGQIRTEYDQTALDKRNAIRLQLASGYFTRKQYNVALDEIKKILAYQPGHVGALNLRGLVYMAMQEDRLAEQSFRAALAVYGRDVNTLQNYGWFLCEKGRYTEAYGKFDQVATSKDYLIQSKAYLTKGICLMRASQLNAAQQALTRAHEIDRANPVIMFNLADASYRNQDYQSARRHVRALNATKYANAESLWLALRIENKLRNATGVRELGLQLRNRYPSSDETIAYERGEFDD